MKTKLTELEKQVLLATYYSDYNEEGRDSIGYPVWYLTEDEVDMEPGQLSGAVSSCSKKGFVEIVKDGNDSTIALTEEGFNRIEKLI